MSGRLPQGFLPVLAFHDISEEPAPWCLPPVTFRRLVGFLAAEGFTAVTMSDLAAYYAGPAQPSADRLVALTFDDGRAGVYRHGCEALAHHGMRATVYAVADWARGLPLPVHERYSAVMTLAQLGEMHAQGHEIGHHSSRHDCFLTLADASVRDEVTIGRRMLENDLGTPVRHFSYPYGHFDARVEALVHGHGGFATVVTNAREVRADPHRHPRLSVKRDLRETDFPALFAPENWRPLAPVICRHAGAEMRVGTR